jgi:ATPase subunit of ABC transporter with duplicated ATPase domains
MLDIDYGEIREYVGNYNYFVRKKLEVIAQKEHQLAHMQDHIAKMKKFIERFRASANRSKQALSREKLLDKMELPDIEKSSRRAPIFDFKQESKSSKQVVNVDKISKSFGNNKVLYDVAFQVNRGDKIALVGPNGIGKSTLLKIIMEKLTADDGTVKLGDTTNISYFAQDHKDLLNEPQTAINYIMNSVYGLPDVAYYGALGRALFDQDQMQGSIKTLSGGEAARLLFAKIMLEKTNTLVLDEPTNHLDLESREALAKSLDNYEGSIICVSHDRHFVSTFANRIIALTKEGVTDYKGTYQEFIDKFGLDYLSR